MERALEKHGEAVESALPAPFDWRALCADAPEMARRLRAGDASGEEGPEAGDGEEGDVSPELDLVEAAEQTFLRSYLGGLAGIALQVEDERDPDALLEALLERLEDEDEEHFEDLVATSLARVERSLAGQGEALDEETAEGAAALLTDAAWPSVEVALEGLAPFDPDSGLELPHSVRQVLSGVARLAAILAALRWIASGAPGGEA